MAHPHLPTAQRRLIIGDLHGCYRELLDLLDTAGYSEKRDTLVCVGDIMGKGPYPLKVLEFLFARGAKIVRGNHDQAALNYADLDEDSLQPGERAYLDCLGPQRDRWLETIRSWPAYLEWEDLIVVHAGLVPGIRELDSMPEHLLMHIRTWDGKGENLNNVNDPPWYELVKPGKTVVFGHWAQKGLINLSGFKGLDTGCVYGRQLTAYCPEEDRFYQAPSKKAYRPV